MMNNALKNLLFLITRIAMMLQSTVQLTSVACDQSAKESEKKKYF